MKTFMFHVSQIQKIESPEEDAGSVSGESLISGSSHEKEASAMSCMVANERAHRAWILCCHMEDQDTDMLHPALG